MNHIWVMEEFNYHTCRWEPYEHCWLTRNLARVYTKVFQDHYRDRSFRIRKYVPEKP